MRKLFALTLLVARIALAAACATNFSGGPICTATVGTSSRNFTTPAACIAGMPTNLVTDGNSYVCSLYNDSLFTTTFTINGFTTDATHTITITAAPGQSFQDNASVRTNGLAVNQANGVAIVASAGYSMVAYIEAQYVTLNRLQIQNTANPGRAVVDNGSYYPTITNCILDASSGSTQAVVDALGYGTLIDDVIVQRGGGTGVACYWGCTIEASTIISPSNLGAGLDGILEQYTPGSTVTSTAIFGFTNPTSGTFTLGGYNATDAASGIGGASTGNVYGVTYSSATPFASSTSTSLNLRSITGTSLIAAGYYDATNAPSDISLQARSNPPTIGAWEVVGTVARRKIFVIN